MNWTVSVERSRQIDRARALSWVRWLENAHATFRWREDACHVLSKIEETLAEARRELNRH